jgi:hypothetical protein
MGRINAVAESQNLFQGRRVGEQCVDAVFPLSAPSFHFALLRCNEHDSEMMFSCLWETHSGIPGYYGQFFMTMHTAMVCVLKVWGEMIGS